MSSFFETVEKARALLERNLRVSVRGLKREFDLDDDLVEELIEELTDVQQLAVRDGATLRWAGAEPEQRGVPPTRQRTPGAYTPKHLAEKILRSKSALEGERKQVTVLFADVKGSMALAEDLDAEQWHRLLDGFFEILNEGIHRFEGTVNQYTGDGIMALFGAPLAHEDHAQRACYAALHLAEKLCTYADALRVDPGVNFAFRIGLNSGEVVVGAIGDDLRMDYTAQGFTVGLAQRMEQLAPADGIALSSATQKLVSGFFELRALGPTRVKGVQDPVEVFVLEGLGTHRTRMDTARSRGLSRFVGRGDELGTLHSVLDQALGGAGRVACVVGEPGVGKSRLCIEFVERCRAQGLAVFEAHCPAHGRAIPYLPLLELLRNLFGITEQDKPVDARQKIAGALALLDDAFADDRALVLEFLGVADPSAEALPLEADVRQGKLFAFIRRLIQLRSEAEPIVLLVDDLHWIDPGSDRFLAQIVEAVSATHTFLLVNYRPEYTADWTRKSWVLQLPVAPLGPDALAELIRDWLGNHPSVVDLSALIAERSGGNPFFAEEIVLSMIDAGHLVGSRSAYELVTPIDSVAVPTTVRAVLSARIDRLGEAEKQTLYTAAVIGKDFPKPILESAMGTSSAEFETVLSALIDAELVHERSIYPVAEYAFKHPLTHEVALNAQLSDARRERHAAVARAIEAANEERLDEYAGLLAHHWTEANDKLLAGKWSMRAAHWVGSSDPVAAKRHLMDAREHLSSLPESTERNTLLLDAYPELINMLGKGGGDPAESDEVFSEAMTLAGAVGDRQVEGHLEAIHAWSKTGQADWAGALEHGRRAIEIADAIGDLPTQLLGRQTVTRALIWRQPLGEAIAVTDDLSAIGAGDQAADIEVLGWRPYLEALSIRAVGLGFIGRPVEALELHERVHALSERSNRSTDTTQLWADGVWSCFLIGDAERGRRYAVRSLEVAERFGSPWLCVCALMSNSLANNIDGRWHDTNRFIEEAHAVIDANSAAREWELLLDSQEALSRAGVGDHERALALARSGLDACLANELMLPMVLAAYLRARVLRMAGDRVQPEELEKQIDEAIVLVEPTGNHALYPMLLIERSILEDRRGNQDAAMKAADESKRVFRSMGVTGWDDAIASARA